MSCDRVLFEILGGMRRTKTNVGIGGQVKDKIRSIHASRQSAGIQDISAHQTEIRGLARCRQKTFLTGGKIVEADHRVTGGQQPFGQRAANEAGTTGNEVSQLAFPRRLAADRGQN